MTAADRKRKQRSLEGAGLIELTVTVDEVSLLVGLVDAGFLTVNEQDDRDKVAAALSRVIEIITANLPSVTSRQARTW
jgi:hypothetical protein